MSLRIHDVVHHPCGSGHYNRAHYAVTLTFRKTKQNDDTKNVIYRVRFFGF